jgi:hypothetical protein
LPAASASAGTGDDHVVGEHFEPGAGAGQPRGDLAVRERRTQIGAVHAIAAADPRLAEFGVPGRERGADCTAGVPRRGLDPDVAERAVALDLAVGHAVERDAAREAKIGYAVFPRQRPGQAQQDLVRHGLNRGRNVHVKLGQRLGLRIARRLAEQTRESAVGHRQAGAIIKIRLIETKRSVFLQVHDLVEDHILEPRVAVRCKAHDLVFARVDLEARVIGESRVKQPERMREMQLLFDLEPVAASDGDRRRRPFADAVDGEHESFLERRGKESARGMTVVMLGEQQPLAHVVAGACLPELLDEQVLQKQFLLDPERHRLAEGREPPRRERQISLEQPLEFEEGLFVEDDPVDVAELDPGFGETGADGAMRERRIVPHARKALFLCRRDDVAADDQRRRAVVIKRRNAEDPQDDLRTTYR